MICTANTSQTVTGWILHSQELLDSWALQGKGSLIMGKFTSFPIPFITLILPPASFTWLSQTQQHHHLREPWNPLKAGKQIWGVCPALITAAIASHISTVPFTLKGPKFPAGYT